MFATTALIAEIEDATGELTVVALIVAIVGGVIWIIKALR